MAKGEELGVGMGEWARGSGRGETCLSAKASRRKAS